MAIATSWANWAKRFVSNVIKLTIIGVATPGSRGSTVGLVYDVWMPITMAYEMGTGPTLDYRGCRDLTSTIVRLKPGVTLQPAQNEIRGLAKRLAAAYPDTNRGVDAIVTPVWAGHLGRSSYCSGRCRFRCRFASFCSSSCARMCRNYSCRAQYRAKKNLGYGSLLVQGR